MFKLLAASIFLFPSYEIFPSLRVATRSRCVASEIIAFPAPSLCSYSKYHLDSCYNVSLLIASCRFWGLWVDI